MAFLPLPLPFTLRLESPHESVLRCEVLIRGLPGKRLVYSGTWQQRPVIAKLFPHTMSARRRWSREQNGMVALSEAGIKTPRILYSGQLADSSFLLVLERLPQAQTVLQCWHELNSRPDRDALLGQLVESICAMHEAGLVQRDLHLENFLVSGRQVFAIDGDSISSRGNQPLDIASSSRNLALLFAQLPPKFDCMAEAPIQHYAQRRGFPGAELLGRLKTDLPLIRRRRRLRYVAKGYRTCSEFIRIRHAGFLAVTRRDAQGDALNRLLGDPEAFMLDGELIKDGNSSTVVRVRAEDCDWAVKRYNLKTPWHAIRRCLRPTRAWTSWGNAHRLAVSGIATPRAIALIEKRLGPFRTTGYYVCDYLDGPDAASFFANDAVSAVDRERTAGEFTVLFELLRSLGIHHGDCKASNFLIRDNTPWVLDLDAMREGGHPAHFRRLYRADRQRFLNNWQHHTELMRWFDQSLAR
jgi:tRNA A-37 threonylcarbamoyl transferase component Bud32